MYWLLDPRALAALVLAIALSATHFVAYRLGKATVRADWDRERAAYTSKALVQEQAFRAKEQSLVAARKHLEDRYVEDKRKAAAAAADAQSELDRLRDALASAPTCQAGSDPTAAERAAGASRLERELFGACAKALTDLAAEADRLEARVVGLQAYVKDVCLKQ